MKIALGSDERTVLTDAVVADLEARGHEVQMVGPPAGEDKAWAEVGNEVGRLVAGGECETAVLFCWTGTGASIAANKVAGVRAALCTDPITRGGRPKVERCQRARDGAPPHEPRSRTRHARRMVRHRGRPIGARQHRSARGGPTTMPTYVMLTTLGPDGWATVRENPERIRQVTKEVESMGLKVVAQYGLLGQWDFLNVIEAPDEASVARAAISLASRGTMRTMTLQAVPIEDLIARLRDDPQ